MKSLIKILLSCLLLMSGIVSASVTPLVISSEFKTENWFPLPVDQMESAAVDAALTRLSGFGKFAFLNNSDAGLIKDSGTLNFSVSLVEKAESAKITIKLSMPKNQGTYVATSSISLSNKNYQGIFKALQQLGSDGAAQLSSSLEAISENEKISGKEQKIRNEIFGLNLTMIDIRKSVKALESKNHNGLVMQELSKLDSLISKVDAHHEYVKRSNEATNRKLDTQHEYVKRSDEAINRKLDTQHEYVKRSNEATNEKLDSQHEYVKLTGIENDRKLNAIYSEISKVNVGRNTDNSLPVSKELSKYDHSQLPKLTKAREMKFNMEFNQARLILIDLLSDRRISLAFSKAVNEELKINLPLYEAEILVNEVSTRFVHYLKDDQYKSMVQRANNLYDLAAAVPELSFKKRIEINEKKDRLNLTVNSMTTVALTMKAASLDMLSRLLHDAIFRNRAMRAMNVAGATDFCPSRESIDSLIKKSNMMNPVISYTGEEESCELVLEESTDNKLVYVFNEQGAAYERKPR